MQNTPRDRAGNVRQTAPAPNLPPTMRGPVRVCSSQPGDAAMRSIRSCFGCVRVPSPPTLSSWRTAAAAALASARRGRAGPVPLVPPLRRGGTIPAHAASFSSVRIPPAPLSSGPSRARPRGRSRATQRAARPRDCRCTRTPSRAPPRLGCCPPPRPPRAARPAASRRSPGPARRAARRAPPCGPLVGDAQSYLAIVAVISLFRPVLAPAGPAAPAPP